MSWSLCSEGGEESKGRGEEEECNSRRRNDGRGSGGKGIVFFPLPSFYCPFFVQVRQEKHIGNVAVLCVGLLWVAYSIFKIVRYTVYYVQ